MAIWGGEIWNGTSALKLGYDVWTSGQTTTVAVYVWTRYAIDDTSNTFKINFCGSEIYNGSVTIKTTGTSNGWDTSRIRELWRGSTTNQTWSISASLKGVEAVGTSNEATVSGSGTTWTSIGAPGKPTITQNNDLSIVISGAYPANGVNNPVSECHIYYKWNASDAAAGGYGVIGVPGITNDNGSYKYTISADKVLDGTHTSISARVYSISKNGWGNVESEVTFFKGVIQSGTITSVPYRYNLNDKSGNFITSGETNLIRWKKNGGDSFKLYLEYPIYQKRYEIAADLTGEQYDLNNNKAREVGLLSMQDGTNWYGDSKQPTARYYDTRVILESYKDNKKIGENYHDIRIEMVMPQTPSNGNVTSSDTEEDGSYKSNKFKISWESADNCNQYVINYEVLSLTGKKVPKEEKEEIVEGHNTTSCEISIPSLLAGQKIDFSIKGRCLLSVNENKVSYDSKLQSTVGTIKKQGGMTMYTNENGNDKYQNYHVCVVNKEGKIVKALATYVYSDNGWKLTKMIF